VRGFADFYQRFFCETPSQKTPDIGLTSIRVPNSENACLGGTPPTKSVIYAALGLPPGGDPLDFPDTPQDATPASGDPPTKSVIYAALGLRPLGGPPRFPDTPQSS
jgi:hypothetical protein